MGGIGRLTSISDASGTRTFGYTQEGWLSYETWQTAGKTFTTGYQYDTFGNITQITYPSGAVVNYTRTMLGDTTAVTRNYDTVVNQVSRAPYGAITQMQHGNGLSEVRALDLNYRTTSVTVPNVLGVTYNYSPDSLISSVDDLFDAYTADIYGYDLVGRLTSADNLGYTYDAAGNGTYRSESGINERYYISSMSNQLIKVGSVSRQYDDNGNLTQRGADTFSYDSHNRLASATVSGTTAYYQYNHLDQRTSKSLNGQTRLMVYDQQGNLIEELDGITGATLAQYIWLDGLLVGYVENNQLYHVHNDHLATPKALTDYAGQIAWKATHDPFGKATVQSSGPTLNIRFPGQYFDEETGLHYNWHRYYDPEIGRYITSDPIGLAGGINTYSYVNGNPVMSTDPTGLVRWKGKSYSFAFVAGGGFSSVRYWFKSAVVNDRRAKVIVVARGLSLGLGLSYGAGAGAVSFNDGREGVIDPYIFNGVFTSLQGAFAPLSVGYGYGMGSLGGAISEPGGGMITFGLDASLSVTVGESKVLQVRWECGDEIKDSPKDPWYWRDGY